MSEASPALSLGSLCRLEARWLDRIEASDRLGSLASRALVVIVVGAAAYGFTFGYWRGPMQALYAGIKLPLLLLLAGLVGLGANAIVGTLLGARLSFAQAGVALLLALAIAATILGSVAPISLLLVSSAPTPDPEWVGLAGDDASLASSLRVAQTLLLWHVFVVGAAGLVGVTRLRLLLVRLVPNAGIARRVLWSWVGIVGLAGAELSWLLRPFLGKPHLEESFFRQQALHGNFFEEMGRILEGTMGSGSVWVVAMGGGIAMIAVLLWLKGSHTPARLKIVEGGVLVGLAAAELLVRWSEIVELAQHGRELRVVRQDAITLRRETYVVRFDTIDGAENLLTELEFRRLALEAGPFRTPR